MRLLPFSCKAVCVASLTIGVCLGTCAAALGQSKTVRPKNPKQPATQPRPTVTPTQPRPSVTVAPLPGLGVLMPTPTFSPRPLSGGQPFTSLSGMGAPSLAGVDGYFMRYFGTPVWNPFGQPLYSYGY